MPQITEEIKQIQPVWTTALEVQERTGGIPLNIIHETLREAEQSGKTWVKREGPESRAGFLININSPEYRTAEERWMKDKHLQPVGPQIQTTMPERPEALYQLAEQWTQLGNFLAVHGLVIYRNAIENEQDWRWMWWDNSTGRGYSSLYEAMVDALKYYIIAVQETSKKPTPLGRLWLQVLLRTFVCLIIRLERFWKWLLS